MQSFAVKPSASDISVSAAAPVRLISEVAISPRERASSSSIELVSRCVTEPIASIEVGAIRTPAAWAPAAAPAIRPALTPSPTIHRGGPSLGCGPRSAATDGATNIAANPARESLRFHGSSSRSASSATTASSSSNRPDGSNTAMRFAATRPL